LAPPPVAIAAARVRELTAKPANDKLAIGNRSRKKRARQGKSPGSPRTGG
jgi:hypothetical protein